jgi:hypothetical protein
MFQSVPDGVHRFRLVRRPVDAFQHHRPVSDGAHDGAVVAEHSGRKQVVLHVPPNAQAERPASSRTAQACCWAEPRGRVHSIT